MKPDSDLAHTKHFFRAVILIVVAALSAVFVRSFLVPPSWGTYGWYRADDLVSQADHEVRHRGNASCTGCHEDIAAEHAGGGHVAVDCELCHAPVVVHARDGEKIADMPRAEESLQLCGRCHREMDARPEDFPQLNPRRHVEGFGMSLDTVQCTTCHSPHKPR